MNVAYNVQAQIERLPGGTFISQAISAIIASITASWDVQHTDDGAHSTISFGSVTGPSIRVGAGTPEAQIVAPVGSLYLRSDGGASTTLWVKESGVGSTGWIAK